MTVPEAVMAVITEEIENVVVFRKPGMSFDQFTGEYSRYLAQAEIDQDPLTSAKYEWETMEKNRGYLFLLTEKHGERVYAEGVSSQATINFKSLMEKINTYHDALSIVVKRIIRKKKSAVAQQAMERMKSGTGDLAIINDIYPLINIVRNNLDIAAQISPGGKDIDEAYLDVMLADTHQANTLCGQVASTDSERSIQVDKQNRLITLCIEAIDEIKVFAEAAFYQDMDYYTEHYSNHVHRERYRANNKEELDEEIEDKENEDETPTSDQ